MNTLLRRYSIVVVAAVVVLASTASAQQQATGIVKGSVRRPNGSPVAAARIVIDSASDSSYTATTKTDDAGNFTISNAPVGGVTVRAYDDKNRVIASAKGVVQKAGETITLVLRAP